MADVGTKAKTNTKQQSIFDALERIGLKAVITELLLREGVVITDDLRDPSMAMGRERLHAMIAALELLGGFHEGSAELAHDRANISEGGGM